jgi:hypothetical protein
MRVPFGSWLGFVKSQSGFTEEELSAFTAVQRFLEAIETTEMSRSYKMLVLLALLNRNQFPGSLPLAELTDEIGAMARRDPKIAVDLGSAASDTNDLQTMVKSNPIAAWVGGRGTGDIRYFNFDDDQLSSQIDIPPASVGAAQELVREIVEWRLAEYFQRSVRSNLEWTLNASHSNGRPLLFLPSREANKDLPEGWIDLKIDDEVVKANFVKIAVNVAHRPGSDENVLPDILSRWFGPDTGKPGTRHQVMLRREGNDWWLLPLGASTGRTVPYKAYRRAEIAPLFGLPYSERYWGQGFVRQGKDTFLFVTLDKTDHTETFQYKDHFLAADKFQWQSQNRTSQVSDAGRSIQTHSAQGITVHLFVRGKSKLADGRGAPFYYCGQAEFVSWAGDKPITVIWRLANPVPHALWEEMAVPDTAQPRL